MKRVTALIVFMISIISLIYSFTLLSPSYIEKKLSIDDEFIDEFRAACAVYTRDGDMASGSGVLLSSGFILSSKHVLDTNRNGRIEDTERSVRVKFFFPPKFYDAYLVTWPHEEWFMGNGKDFVFLVAKNGPTSKITLSSEEVKIGTRIFTIGVPDGITPPHIYDGLKSTDYRSLARASLSSYFGNSGGGVFVYGKNTIIGLTTQIRLDHERFMSSIVVPQWMEYVTSLTIRDYAHKYNMDFLVDETGKGLR